MNQAHQEEVSRIELPGKEVILVGTAHISQQSVDMVREIIEREQPDVVCVELDDERVKSMSEQQNWEALNLKQIIRNGQLMFLVARLALMAFQKRMGSYTNVKPGAEMAAAMEIAKAQGAELVLCDRNVRITLLRSWRKTPWYKRAGLGGMIFAGLFQKSEISEEELADLRQSQNIGSILDEMGEALPEVKGVLVDERDTFMAHQIQQAQGKKIVVIIGAAHKPGIERKILEPIGAEVIEEISTIPAKSALSKIIPWILPLLIIGLFAWGFTRGDIETFKRAMAAWILANGILCALGASIAMAHPLTILAAFVAAPLTSLNPTIGAGMVTAFVQTFVASPRVRDLEHIGDDIVNIKGWWSNRLGRVVLVFLFSNIGSALGTFIALKWIIPMASAQP